jgi:hypothetical protein
VGVYDPELIITENTKGAGENLWLIVWTADVIPEEQTDIFEGVLQTLVCAAGIPGVMIRVDGNEVSFIAFA